ncbi:MAG: hypothetical protein DME98_17995 [Verrucomicrobia bacterium]|nr:MAG: hypothetical protein DME98_17995 [Verrucomicrobiota bacterium]PYJ33719.1 MAG: hypothetical protein DME88_07470 [Verrucomicrobiota bacterium]
MPSTIPAHVYEVRRRKDHRGVDLISDALPFGRLWYGEPNTISNAVDYAKFRSRSHECCDSRLRWSWRRDRHARRQGRFQRTVSVNARETISRYAVKRDGAPL